MRILRAVDRAREYLPLRAVLRFLRVSPSRFHAWRRRQSACALDDQSSCPRTSPYRLTPPEVRAIEDMVTSPECRHVPTGKPPTRRRARDSAVRGDGHVPGALDEIPRPVVVALLRAPRGRHGDDHRPFAHAAQLLEDIAGRPPT